MSKPAPTYAELMRLYFDTKRALIAEFSGSLRRDTRKLYDECNAWLAMHGDAPLPDMDTITTYSFDEEED